MQLEIMTKPDVIVIACNTASTAALDDIRQAVQTAVVGVVPAIKPAAAASRTKIIGVLGTPGTVRHEYVDGLIADFASDCEVRLWGSSLLVEQAEKKLAGQGTDTDILKREIMPLFKPAGQNPDHIVLACTHFPLLRDELTSIVPQPVHWIDSGEAIARRVESILTRVMHNEKKTSDAALLIGPDITATRRSAFARFGFDRVVGLVPG